LSLYINAKKESDLTYFDDRAMVASNRPKRLEKKKMPTESTANASVVSSSIASAPQRARRGAPAPAAAPRVLNSFVGLEPLYQDFLASLSNNKLNARVLDGILHVFAGGKLRDKLVKALDLSSQILKLTRELSQVEKELRQYGIDFITNWKKANPVADVCSTRMVPNHTDNDYSVLVSVRQAFSVDDAAILALKSEIEAVKNDSGNLYSQMFEEKTTFTVKNGPLKDMLFDIIRQHLGEKAVDTLFDKETKVKVFGDKYEKLLEVLPQELRTKVSLVVNKAAPAIKYPK